MSAIGGQYYGWDLFANLSPLDKQQKKHVQKVYGYMALAGIAATFGALLSLHHNLGGFMTMAASIACLSGIYSLPATKELELKRASFLLGHATCVGMSLGPLLDSVASIDPRLISIALLGTFTVFVCFSLAAMLTVERYSLYLGSLISTSICLLGVMGLANHLVHNDALALVSLYIGLVLFSGCVVCDTQNMLEQAAYLHGDSIGDGLQLFSDFVGMFVRVTLIMARNATKRQKKKVETNK